MVRLGVVENIFKITGRGTIVTCPRGPQHPFVRNGLLVELRRGSVLVFQSSIHGWDLQRRSRSDQREDFMILIANLERETVSVGDEIWIEATQE